MSDGAHDTLVAIIAATAAFAGAALGGLVSLLTTERRIAMENVTQERAKWRTEIRRKADDAYLAILGNDPVVRQKVRSQFALLLSPRDSEDRHILDTVTSETSNQEAQAREFIDRISLLLKHDWERAKREASLYLRILQKEPRRVTYEEFVNDPINVRYEVWRCPCRRAGSQV